MEKIKINFSFVSKVKFYLSYFFYKLFLLREVNNPKLKVFIIEWIYSVNKFTKLPIKPESLFKVSLVQTRYGKFNIRSGTEDVICASPAFERLDINHLIKLIKYITDKNKRILFLDVGSDFGSYAITIGNSFKNYKKLDIVAFEPIKSSFDLLTKNINDNELAKKIKAFNFALSDKTGFVSLFYDSKQPGSSRITSRSAQKSKSKTLDSIGTITEGYDALIFKIDVEGFEANVLKGALKTINNSKEVFILVEDFVDFKVIEYLEVNGFEFVIKLTPYNSFWVKK